MEFDFAQMRDRLKAELERQNKSMTEVSRAAGLSKGYVRNILVRDQVPTVENLDKVCKTLNISMIWLMYGRDFPKDADRVFDLLEQDPDKFYALLELATR